MSRAIDLLNAIKNNTTYSDIAQSRIETILKSIANNTTNLVNISNIKTNDYLVAYDVTELKGKIISASVLINNLEITGTGGRIRIDILDNSLVTNYFGNIVAGGTNDTSKIENLSIPNTATKVTFYLQSFSSSSDYSTFEQIMINEGTVAKPYTEYIENVQSRYEELLLCIKNNVTTTLTAQTRLEEILIAIANGTELPTKYQSELEEAYALAFGGE